MNDLAQLFSIGRDITVTGILFVALWAFATGRVITPKYHADILVIKDAVIANRDDQIADLKDRLHEKELEVQKWTKLSFDFATASRDTVETTGRAVEVVTRRAVT